MMQPDISLNGSKTKAVTDFLNGYLSDLQIAYGKLRSYHWNVEGKNFFSLHAKLEEFYETAAEEIDEIAERVLMLGSRPVSTLKEFVEKSKLKEAPAKSYGSDEVGENLLQDFSYLISRLREGIRVAEEDEDQGTVDLLTESLRYYEKASWMIRAYLG